MTDKIPQEIREIIWYLIKTYFNIEVTKETLGDVIISFNKHLASKGFSIVLTKDRYVLDRKQLKKLCEEWQKAHYWMNGKIVKPPFNELLAEIKEKK